MGKQKQKPVVIAHLRLDAELEKINPALERQRAARIAATSGEVSQFVESEILAPRRERKAISTAKRIKEINTFLGDRENALAEIKLRGSPMALLIEKASAKGEELMAAQEIETAWFAISGALMFKPLSMERGSRGRPPEWSDKVSKAVDQYQTWADHWSKRKKAFLDYTLECVIGAVIDQRPIRAIAEDLGFHHSKIERAVLAGLRDYAARAGWVDNALSRQWMAAAEQTFKRRAVA